MENLWGDMRSHFLSNRAYEGYNRICDEVGKAYRALTPDTLRSVCRCGYLERGL